MTQGFDHNVIETLLPEDLWQKYRPAVERMLKHPPRKYLSPPRQKLRSYDRLFVLARRLQKFMLSTPTADELAYGLMWVLLMSRGHLFEPRAATQCPPRNPPFELGRGLFPTIFLRELRQQLQETHGSHWVWIRDLYSYVVHVLFMDLLLPEAVPSSDPCLAEEKRVYYRLWSRD